MVNVVMRWQWAAFNNEKDQPVPFTLKAALGATAGACAAAAGTPTEVVILNCAFPCEHFCVGLAHTCLEMELSKKQIRLLFMHERHVGIQAMKVINGVPEYSGLMDVFKKVLYNEGVLAFWKGFTPYYMKLGPYTVLSFVFLEQFNAAYLRQFVYNKKKARTEK
ncbi:hypothetical protein KIN20_034280 [Parelaphostrongylus tenuis]|uniref:Mitochondrial 2-oxoglutarate/malate carrier protein n=1 Tax=Parelaphostrongylus tenuis TaxID=148309 RepID=A0AAD5R9T1_PARTN|nr:hypothetical protein KIN20_034280 [Parelaphostrongylus tenuis]